MCLLLVYVSTQAVRGRYRVILASNRDESFGRPAKPADFWEKNSEVVGGLDMTPGKEGGTWLGASLRGRIGVLLNVSGTSSDSTKQGRGFIVSDYLTTPETTAVHLTQLKNLASTYNPFHLVTIDVNDNDYSLRHFCNIGETITDFSNGCYVFCNSSLEKPYLKATAAQKKFDAIIERLGRSKETKDELVSNLLSLLRDEKRYYPDPVIDGLPGLSSEMRPYLSSICVRPFLGTYGTRTNTVILIDEKGTVDFHEWTLKMPALGGVLDWIKTHHQFQITR